MQNENSIARPRAGEGRRPNPLTAKHVMALRHWARRVNETTNEMESYLATIDPEGKVDSYNLPALEPRFIYKRISDIRKLAQELVSLKPGPESNFVHDWL